MPIFKKIVIIYWNWKMENTYRGWTQTEYLKKHYNINQKDEDT